MDLHLIGIIVALSVVGINLFAVMAARRIDAKGRSATGASVLVAIITTCLLSYAIYAYYINMWAVFVLVPAVILFGIPTLVTLLILALKHCVNWWCFIWVLPLWFLLWITIAKPYGIICHVAVRQARSSFFIPADAIRLKLTPPRRQGSAQVRQEYFSRLSTDELLSFFSNQVIRAGFTLTRIKSYDVEDTRAFYPYHIVNYRTTVGRNCSVWIYEFVPYKGLEETRMVRSEYHFNKAFGYPPVGL